MLYRDCDDSSYFVKKINRSAKEIIKDSDIAIFKLGGNGIFDLSRKKLQRLDEWMKSISLKRDGAGLSNSWFPVD